MRMKTVSLHKHLENITVYIYHFTCLQLMDVLLLASNVALQIKLE